MSWREFIESAVTGPAAEPFLAYLLDQVHGGHRVVRVHVGVGPSGQSGYAVLLVYGGALTTLHIPHSEAFTRWTFGTGIRMASEAEEAERVAWVLGDRLGWLEGAIGGPQLDAIVASHVRELGAPRAAGVARTWPAPPAQGVVARIAGAWIIEVLAMIAEALVHGLSYESESAASILDDALLSLLRRLHERPKPSPPK